MKVWIILRRPLTGHVREWIMSSVFPYKSLEDAEQDLRSIKGTRLGTTHEFRIAEATFDD